MNAKSILIVLTLLCLTSSCQFGGSATPTQIVPQPDAKETDTPIPTVVTTVPLPEITLRKGDLYFTVDGKQSFLFSRNLAGYETGQYDRLLDLVKGSGTQLVRIQLDSMGTGITADGNVDEAWTRKWEHVFDKAQENGIQVLPVFSGWFDWNNGNPDYGYSTWASNAFNAANGGPTTDPGELFQKDSVTQKMWLQWMKALVERWQGWENIAAWEIFSEVNIATGSTEANSVAFIEKAAALIREADPRGRPITASLADVGEWTSFYQSEAVDFINIHPYPPSAQLDRTLITNVNRMLITYQKPVLIGESGLSAATPDKETGKLTVAEHADRGVSHAIWAAVVSGAANGRSLYWEDGFGIYFPKLSWPFLEKYAKAELPAANFVRDVDFAGFQPLITHLPAGTKVWGAAAGNEKTVIGWFRDAKCEPSDWTLEPVISGQTIAIEVPGTAREWKVNFYDTKTGTDIIHSTTVTRKGTEIIVLLPDFQDDIAFKMTASGGTISTSAKVNTDPIAGKWSGIIANDAGTFSTRVDLEIQPGCDAGKICGTFSAPQLPCSGELFLQEVTEGTFILIEQNITGADSCASGGYEYLQLQPDGTLSYTFALTPGSTEMSRGTLHHP